MLCGFDVRRWVRTRRLTRAEYLYQTGLAPVTVVAIRLCQRPISAENPRVGGSTPSQATIQTLHHVKTSADTQSAGLANRHPKALTPGQGGSRLMLMANGFAMDKPLSLNVEVEPEPETGRWIADVPDIPGVLAYGATASEAIARVKVLAIEVVGDRLANGEDPLTGCELGEACPPYEVAAGFAGIEFHHDAVACY